MDRAIRLSFELRVNAYDNKYGKYREILKLVLRIPVATA